MRRVKFKYFNLTFAVGDILLLIFAFSTGFMIRHGSGTILRPEYYFLELYMIILWLVIGFKRKLYDNPRFLHIDRYVVKNINALWVFFFIVSASLYLLTKYEYSRLHILWTFLLFFIYIVIWRIIIFQFIKISRRSGKDCRTIVFAGGGDEANEFHNILLTNAGYGFRLKAVFDDTPPTNELNKYYKGKLSELKDFCKQNEVDELLIALPDKMGGLMDELVLFAENQMIRVRLIPEFYTFFHKHVVIDYFENIPVMRLRVEPLESLSNRMIKRLFDVVFSTLVIVLIFSWLFPLLAIIIKLTSKGPVFFAQKRTGRNNATFTCYKFRSMAVNKEADALQATQNDPRITKIGAFLRKSNLDELPQFFNVLFGHMSVVGPRPHMLKHTEDYRHLVEKFMVRHFAKPGITGWAQIKGFRGETKEVSGMENRALADIWYIENWSLPLDMKIIVLTVWNMFKGDENAR